MAFSRKETDRERSAKRQSQTSTKGSKKKNLTPVSKEKYKNQFIEY